ncbi:uncharacterized protein IL334_006451 [Kwoniella shivajii]|uniref:Uncharacterized protein n=1 Tax=Kwoniella shivajii TaxID=564305 RepID=A0ABZ1D6C0_9TREE|nr:hypothetical protein IL334_006451 [Kwoniella shivajii]
MIRSVASRVLSRSLRSSRSTEYIASKIEKGASGREESYAETRQAIPTLTISKFGLTPEQSAACKRLRTCFASSSTNHQTIDRLRGEDQSLFRTEKGRSELSDLSTSLFNIQYGGVRGVNWRAKEDDYFDIRSLVDSLVDATYVPGIGEDHEKECASDE